MKPESFIIGPDDPILITGATGFIGPAIVESLVRHGFRNLRTLVRPSSDVSRLNMVASRYETTATVEVTRGNLLSPKDCATATKGVALVFHLATGGAKSFPDAFMNSVVTTSNLLEATLLSGCLRRFVNISSFAVYANSQKTQLDELSPVVAGDSRKRDAYTYAKLKQDEIVIDYGSRFAIPYVIVRPGSVFGPGKESITGRVGLDTFGIFLHLGGSNPIPFTYIDNCADAIVLAGVMPGVDKEVFNIVDDNLPSSRQFLRQYKRNVRSFASIYVPRFMSFALCRMWESYSRWSQEQLPPAFSRTKWQAEWKKTRYSNKKAKAKLGWAPAVPMTEGLVRYFEDCKRRRHTGHA